MTAKLRLGYVGVGLMGLPMAKRLCPSGTRSVHTTSCRIRSKPPARPARHRTIARGRAAAPTGGPQPADDRSRGAGGVRRGRRGFGVRPPQLVIDFSTIKVEKCKAFAASSAARRGWVDRRAGLRRAAGLGRRLAHRDGRRRAAEIERARRSSPTSPAGSRTWAGRERHGREDAEPAHRRLRLCGDGGGGVLAEAAGIDPARLPECLAGGHADSSLLQRIYPRIVTRDSRRRATCGSS